MPTVLRIGPYRLFFVSLDGEEPPHIHVRREKMVAKIWLQPIKVARPGGFREAELRKLVKLINEHREELLEKWDVYFER
jgi:hypothetical protein